MGLPHLSTVPLQPASLASFSALIPGTLGVPSRTGRTLPPQHQQLQHHHRLPRISAEAQNGGPAQKPGAGSGFGAPKRQETRAKTGAQPKPDLDGEPGKPSPRQQEGGAGPVAAQGAASLRAPVAGSLGTGPAPTVRRRAPVERPLLRPEDTASDAVLQAETYYVRALALFFLVILMEGLALASSSFLSPELDAWVFEKLYPTFSPTVGVFVAFSALYGALKAFGTKKR